MYGADRSAQRPPRARRRVPPPLRQPSCSASRSTFTTEPAANRHQGPRRRPSGWRVAQRVCTCGSRLCAWVVSSLEKEEGSRLRLRLAQRQSGQLLDPGLLSVRIELEEHAAAVGPASEIDRRKAQPVAPCDLGARAGAAPSSSYTARVSRSTLPLHQSTRAGSSGRLSIRQAKVSPPITVTLARRTSSNEQRPRVAVARLRSRHRRYIHGPGIMGMWGIHLTGREGAAPREQGCSTPRRLRRTGGRPSRMRSGGASRGRLPHRCLIGPLRFMVRLDG